MVGVGGWVDMAMLDLKTWSVVGEWWSRMEVMKVGGVGGGGGGGG